MNLFYSLCLLLSVVNINESRNHHLILKNDERKSVLCTQFGFFQSGKLIINLEKLEIYQDLKSETNQFGFTLDKAPNAGMSSYLETKLDRCLLSDTDIYDTAKFSALIFVINIPSKRLIIKRIGNDLKGIIIVARINHQGLKTIEVKDYNSANSSNKFGEPVGSIPLQISDKTGAISFGIVVQFPTKEVEGLYSLYFHDCLVGKKSNAKVNLTVNLIEQNKDSYLSAGDQPLPVLFIVFCIVYFVLSVVWLTYLKYSKHMVYKVHYLMLLVIVVKALSLMFHGINYYVLGKQGIQEEGWAVMYYITHLLKGALLFVTIVFIGTGWAFIKHMLSSKEKRVFLVIIPLQILANVATIIIDESEEGNARYTYWKDILILVDLICCGAILFPVIWSIRHLQQAAGSDGKAAVNLQKLKLFRHFYIIIICYIYFTRIIVYLINITTPFAYLWLVTFSKELATLIFIITTGYKFRPVSNNPYLLVPLDDEEEAQERKEMEHVWSQSGISEDTIHLTHMKNSNEDSDTEETAADDKPVV